MKLQFVHRPYQGSIVKGLYIQCEEVGSTKSKGKLKTYLLHLWIADEIMCALITVVSLFVSVYNYHVAKVVHYLITGTGYCTS